MPSSQRPSVSMDTLNQNYEDPQTLLPPIGGVKPTTCSIQLMGLLWQVWGALSHSALQFHFHPLCANTKSFSWGLGAVGGGQHCLSCLCLVVAPLSDMYLVMCLVVAPLSVMCLVTAPLSVMCLVMAPLSVCLSGGSTIVCHVSGDSTIVCLLVWL